MRIERVKIKNYKLFYDFSMTFNDDLNIIVGDNETGKSTLLEAISLALTAQISGRSIQYELTPFLFSMGAVKQYVDGLQTNPYTALPEILIEVFLKEDATGELAQYKGTNNSERRDCPGVYFKISFDNDYAPEYQEYISNAAEVRTIPIEYYSYTWLSFANNTFKFSQLPSRVMLLDRSDQRLQNGSDKYIAKIIDDTLDKSESALLSLLYRKQKEVLSEQESMTSALKTYTLFRIFRQNSNVVIIYGSFIFQTKLIFIVIRCLILPIAVTKHLGDWLLSVLNNCLMFSSLMRLKIWQDGISILLGNYLNRISK